MSERPAHGSPSRNASDKLMHSAENEARLTSGALRLGEPRAGGAIPVIFAEHPSDAGLPAIENMNRFESKLDEHHLVLRRGQFQTLQINVGRKCNQTCRH